jgi:hypothetical protein
MLGSAFAVINDDGFDLEDPYGSHVLTPGNPITLIYFLR